MKLGKPTIDAFTSYMPHVYNNPIAYDIPVDNITPTVVKEKFGAVAYVISREAIECGDTSEVREFLDTISSSREVALTYMQKVEFSVDGYNDDSRELFEIDEVVTYLTKLNQEFPYWMFFQFEHGHWLKLIAFILGGASRQHDGSWQVNRSRMEELCNSWFIALNQLCHRCAIDETRNRKITNDAMKVIFGSVAAQTT